MRPSEVTIGVIAAVLVACGGAERPDAGDTAAVRMEEQGAVTEKTLPSGEVDTAAVRAPARVP